MKTKTKFTPWMVDLKIFRSKLKSHSVYMGNPVEIKFTFRQLSDNLAKNSNTFFTSSSYKLSFRPIYIYMYIYAPLNLKTWNSEYLKFWRKLVCKVLFVNQTWQSLNGESHEITLTSNPTMHNVKIFNLKMGKYF